MTLVDLVAGRGTVVALVLALVTTSAVAVTRHEHRGRVVVTDTDTQILDAIEFEPGTARLRPSCVATLDAVASTLRGNPEIALVEVQSHAASGDDAATLTDRRARVVMSYLVVAGVEPSRLTAQGYGTTQPIVPGVSEKNERIAFVILRRASDAP